MAEIIKPTVRFGKKLFYIKPVDLFNIAYLWSPKPDKEAVETNLYSLGEYTTYHEYGYYGLFKPSISEVLSQVPKDIQDKVVAFEIINLIDFDEDLDALNDGYHVAKTRFYGEKMTENNKNEIEQFYFFWNGPFSQWAMFNMMINDMNYPTTKDGWVSEIEALLMLGFIGKPF